MHAGPQVIEDVRSVVSVSKTCIYFKTSGATADEVHVCNGKAYAVVPIYQKYEAGISARVRTGEFKKAIAAVRKGRVPVCVAHCRVWLW